MKKANPINLAIADDHILFLSGISSLLDSQENFKVEIQAYCGADLLNKLSCSDSSIDVCLLDVNMPGMNGLDVLLEIKKIIPHLPVLIISMHYHEYIIINMLRNGGGGFILKDTNPEELFTAIETIYKTGYYHTNLVNNYYHKASQIQTLNKIERQFLALCCEELTYKEIADKMHLSSRTIEGYRDNLFKRIGVKNRSGLVMFAVKNGMV